MVDRNGHLLRPGDPVTYHIDDAESTAALVLRELDSGYLIQLHQARGHARALTRKTNDDVRRLAAPRPEVHAPRENRRAHDLEREADAHRTAMTRGGAERGIDLNAASVQERFVVPGFQLELRSL
jgi:hypothetical protein